MDLPDRHQPGHERQNDVLAVAVEGEVAEMPLRFRRPLKLGGVALSVEHSQYSYHDHYLEECFEEEFLHVAQCRSYWLQHNGPVAPGFGCLEVSMGEAEGTETHLHIICQSRSPKTSMFKEAPTCVCSLRGRDPKLISCVRILILCRGTQRAPILWVVGHTVRSRLPRRH